MIEQKLLFVYNAETGLFNKLTDFAHKLVSPGTYACSLCALTYGKFTIKQEWTNYIKNLPMKVEFVYRNEWKFVSVRDEYPLVALQTGQNRIEILLEAAELNQIKSMKQLKHRLDEALQNACC